MGKKSTETRRIVLEMLMELQTDLNQKEHILLKNVLNKYDYLDRQDKAFITFLYEGVLRNRIKIDYVINQFAKTKNGKIKPLIKNILRMTVFQIMYMDSVPDSAACNEAVNMAVDRGMASLKGFVNGVSRNVARNKDNISWPDKDNNTNEYLSINYSMPLWIVEYLIKLYDFDKTVVMLEAMSKPADIMIRINEKLSKSELEKLLEELDKAGNSPVKHSYLDYAFTISKVDGMETVPGFMEGLLTVQDVSSQLAVDIAGIKGGDRILDLCSAPGGKTMHAALKTGKGGIVDARDLSEYKLDSIRENAERLNLNNVTVSQADASVFDDSLVNSYDVVIVDAPCSGLGVMGKKSDIRYNVSLKMIEELSLIQRKILSNAVKYVKPGGTLLFLTCTITKEENLDNYKWLSENEGVKPVSFEEMLPEGLKGQGGDKGYLQLLPGVHNCDGFFISKYMTAVSDSI